MRVKNELAYQFYQCHTNISKRLQILKEILRQSTELEKHILMIYHDYLSQKKDFSRKIYNLIYQISKDILCGKQLDGLVESIQSKIRLSFTNFVTNMLQYIVNDYGLDALSTLSAVRNGYKLMLKLIDYSSFVIDDEKDIVSSLTQGIFYFISHYACVPQTPFYHLLHQRIQSYAEEIKLALTLKQVERKSC